MLREITALRSQPGRRRKRWFSDDAMDLFIWCDAEGRIEAFQLTLKTGDGPGREHAVSWYAGTGFTHHVVDDGEQRPGRYKSTPLLVPSAGSTGGFREAFAARAGQIDPDVRAFVDAKLAGRESAVGAP